MAARVEDCETCEKAGPMTPNHHASIFCESGMRDHCTCGVCY